MKVFLLIPEVGSLEAERGGFELCGRQRTAATSRPGTEKQRTALGGGTSVMGERERVASWKAQNAVFQEVKTRSDQRS